MPEKQESKACMDVREMADYLGISIASAYALCRKPDFPVVRVSPRRLVVPVEGLREWMARNYGV